MRGWVLLGVVPWSFKPWSWSKPWKPKLKWVIWEGTAQEWQEALRAAREAADGEVREEVIEALRRSSEKPRDSLITAKEMRARIERRNGG